MSTCRFKYFGTFAVYPTKVKGFQTRLENMFKEGKVDEVYYTETKMKIKNYLDKND